MLKRGEESYLKANTISSRSEFLFKIYDLLLKEFGYQGWWPLVSLQHTKGFDAQGYHPGIYDHQKTKQQRLEIIIGAILTQNTSWKNVETAIYRLYIKKLFDKDNLKKISEEELASLIHSSGYFRQKAKKIKMVISFLDSRKEINRENLLQVWGIGKETADSILLYAYHQPYFVIDAYTKRIFQRMGFKYESYESFQELFHQHLAKDARLYQEYHALIVRLAKISCRTKPLCKNCVLNRLCQYGKNNV
ncbi:endonuclease [Candidatus Woesearchaeota archaeon]|nr:endonuclease [Candidatus Woesearchaeota archaeon]